MALDLFPGYPSGMSTSPGRFWKVAVVVDILRTVRFVLVTSEKRSFRERPLSPRPVLLEFQLRTHRTGLGWSPRALM